MIVCIFLPRFELSVAAGGLEALAGRAIALAPEGGGSAQRIGEVSGAAQAFGVRQGMALGEALARCPPLELLAGDPVAVAAAWEQGLQALEGIGAAVEPQRPGVACFDAQGLRGLHGIEERVIAAALRTLQTPARAGGGATRFCALAAALRARPRRPVILRGGAREHLRELSVSLLRSREECAGLVGSLERLGVSTLGDLAALPRAGVADRFGEPGVVAHRLACGEDDPPRPRAPVEPLEELFELPESASGPQLEQVLGVLIDRLLARPERRGRSLRGAVLAAQLIDGGSWRAPVAFREALSDPRRMRLALGPRTALLPSPAVSLSLSAAGFGPVAGEQRSLLAESRTLRRARLREAVGQARTAAGPGAALRVLYVDLPSRIPERRVMLAPFES